MVRGAMRAAVAIAVYAGFAGISVQAHDPSCACPPAYGPSCAAPPACTPSCAAPGSCDCDCQPACRKSCDSCRSCVVKVIKVRAPRFCCVKEAPYAAVTQSVPAVLTNQSAFLPVGFQAVALQAAPVTRPQSAAADSDCEDLKRQVNQLRKDVDELAETSNRITKVLEKLDSKLDDIDGRLKGKGI